jgi:trimeric autotransporter adhesin
MRHMSLAFAAAVALASIGCGGSSGTSLAPDALDHDASAPFAGHWSGTLTLEANGQTQSSATDIEVDVSGRNTLAFPGLCKDSAPAARVTSDTAFTVASHTCSIPSSSCTITWQIAGGSGSLSAGTLRLLLNGAASGCNAPAGATLSFAFAGTKQAPFFISFLSPSSITAGASGFTLQVNGTAFPADAVVQWNGSPRTTSFVSGSVLQAQIPASDVASGGTALVTVMSPSAGSTTAPATFQVIGAPPPSVFSIAPSSAVAGSGAFTLQVSGGAFATGAVVRWNGSPRATTFIHSGLIQAQILAADVATAGTAQVTVANGPGGTPSAPVPFDVQAPQPGVTILSLPVRDMVWDPARQKIYVSLNNTSPTNPNTITAVDPFTATFDAGAFAGSQPNRLALSDDGQFLYAGIDGAAAVQRFTLPGLAQDLRISLGSDPFFGPYHAGDVQVAPGAPRAIAVSLAVAGVSPSAQGGVVVFDDAVARATRAAGFGGTGLLFNSLQWGADATTLYAANTETTGFDFYELSVTASGVTLAHDHSGTFSGFANGIHFDPVTRLVYSDDGHVIDPATGLPGGTYGTAGPMVPDGKAGVAVFVTSDFSTSNVTIRTFDLTRFTSVGSFVLQRVSGRPIGRVLRWGADGIAFATDAGQLVLTHYPHP